ncbi:MAG: cell division protein FtsL [Sporolactobacillus sp.]
MSQSQRVVNEVIWTEQKVKREQEPAIFKRRVTRGEKILWLIASLIIFIFAVEMVSNQVHLFSTSRDIAVLQGRLDNQQKVVQQLKTEVDSLSSPERIVEFAEKELGLRLDVNQIKILP